MWGVPPSLKGFFPQDDAQDPDTFYLTALGVPTTPTDLLLNGIGPTGPVAPNHYTLKILTLEVTMPLSSATVNVVKFFILNPTTSASSMIKEIVVPNVSTFQESETAFKFIAPPGFKFQASAATTADIFCAARLVKGAGQ